MPDDDLTSGNPGPADGSTPEPEPDNVTEQPAEPDKPQPTLEELQAELTRLKANNKGTYQEWQRERQARERAEAIAARMSQSLPVQQAQTAANEPSDEDLAEMESTALLDGNKQKLAEIRRYQRQRILAEGAEIQQRQINQAQAAINQQNAFKSYLVDAGVANATDQNAIRLNELFKEMESDPRYAYTQGNLPWLLSLAAERLKAETAGKKSVARETARQESAEAAMTERGSKGTGTLPGKAKPDNKIYLTEEERTKAVSILVRAGYSRSDAEKRYWENLDPRVRERRIAEKRA